MERDKLYTKVVVWGAGQALLKWNGSDIFSKIDYIVDRNKGIQGGGFLRMQNIRT